MYRLKPSSFWGGYFWLFAACLVFAITPPTWGQDLAGSAKSQFSFAAEPGWVLALDTVDKRPPPTSQGYIRLHDEQVHINEDGAVDTYVHMIVGAADLAAIAHSSDILFQPGHQSVVLHKLGLRRKGAFIDKALKVRPLFLTNEPDQSVSMYYGGVTVRQEIPDLALGDEVEISYTIHDSGKDFGKFTQVTAGWRGDVNSILFRREVIGFPASLKLYVTAVADPVPARSRASHWQHEVADKNGRHQEIWRDQDIPAFFPIANVPEDMGEDDLIVVSPYNSWEEVGDWFTAQVRAIELPRSKEFQAALASVRAGKTAAQKASLALRYVQREIRYVGVLLGEHGYRPNSPDEVLENRWGDCKDKTVLLIQLLRGAGVEVQPAILNWGNTQLVSHMPPMRNFNHMVAIAWIDGKPYVLDGVVPEQASELAHIGQWHDGADALLLDGPKKGLIRLEATDSEQDHSYQRVNHMVVSPGGKDAKFILEETFHGVHAEEFRQTLKQQPMEARKQDIILGVRQRYLSATWIGDAVVQDDLRANVIKTRYEFAIKDPLSHSGTNESLFKYSLAPIEQMLPPADEPDRALPVGLGLAVRHSTLVEILDLPKDLKVTTPPAKLHKDGPSWRFDYERAMTAQHVEAKYDIVLLSDRVETKDLGAFNEGKSSLKELDKTFRVENVSK